jgi:hypothetical protein
MYQQLWGYKVEDKLYLGVREQKGLNTTVTYDAFTVVRRKKKMSRPHCILLRVLIQFVLLIFVMSF